MATGLIFIMFMLLLSSYCERTEQCEYGKFREWEKEGERRTGKTIELFEVLVKQYFNGSLQQLSRI